VSYELLALFPLLLASRQNRRLALFPLEPNLERHFRGHRPAQDIARKLGGSPVKGNGAEVASALEAIAQPSVRRS
jgi:hypothetical protein